ncbi:alkaline phosphatase family protein [Paraburkholderia sp. Tr-20389]|nr:alkaline phosphatase family protein [Paraburkholderia sp. Tr-20389]
MSRLIRWVGAGALAGSMIVPLTIAHAEDGQGRGHDNDGNAIRHVLLISVDGLHEQDVARCIGANTCPNISLLAKSGVTYTNAYTPGLSDSFPGLAALVTGGSPKSAGLFYDVSYDRTLYAPSDTGCTGTQGWNVVFDETTGIDAQGGGALTHLDGGGAFNPDAIPRAKRNGKCTPVYPHDYIKTNTIFEVVKEHIHDARTAWADKHAWGYDWLNGPSGRGVDDLSRTEINSINPATGNDYTDLYTNTEIFDNFHVASIISEIDGKDSTGKRNAPVPTLFGTNFQTLSVAQKAPVAKDGGYVDTSFTPGKQVAAAIGYVDDSIGKMVAELKARNLASSTMVIVTAKHGQSPTDHSKLVKNGDTLTALLESKSYLDPNGNFGQNNNTKALNDGTGRVGTGMVQTDDVGLIWLRDQSQLSQVVATLNANLTCGAPGICADGPQAYILSGARLASMFGDPSNGRTPDIIVQPNPGVIYTSSTKKDEEHGGNGPDDSHLGLIVSFPDGRHHGKTVERHVTTTQVAPTILRALGVAPEELHSVQVEGTRALPGLHTDD